ncbi:hypothetical protein ASZ90_019600 [hydrocarbon metagenome]|uniref:Uncharacterized protein n=1 Tax=hydrocarbon metagenome TaxID=938273 RepID=A0A0W8E3S0_9ZZZZ
MLVNAGRLYFIHLSAFAAGILSIYFPGMDILVALIYLLVIALEARRAYELPLIQKIATGFIWQAPGLFFALLLVSSYDFMGLYEYAIFMLQFWFTPLLGLLSLAGINFYFDKPLYYYLLIYLPIISCVYYIGIASISFPGDPRGRCR